MLLLSLLHAVVTKIREKIKIKIQITKIGEYKDNWILKLQTTLFRKRWGLEMNCLWNSLWKKKLILWKIEKKRNWIKCLFCGAKIIFFLLFWRKNWCRRKRKKKNWIKCLFFWAIFFFFSFPIIKYFFLHIFEKSL